MMEGVLLAVFLCLAAIMEDQIEVEGWELEALEESLDCYKPTREICGVGTVTAVSRSAQKGEMIIYTRNGIEKAKSPEYRCNSRATNCRTLHGYFMVISKRKEKSFEADALKNKILVISSQTAFEIKYLVENFLLFRHPTNSRK